MNTCIPSNFTSSKHIIPKCLGGSKLHDRYTLLELSILVSEIKARDFSFVPFPTSSEAMKRNYSYPSFS